MGEKVCYGSTAIIGTVMIIYSMQVDSEGMYITPGQNIGSLYEQLHQKILSRSSIRLVLIPQLNFDSSIQQLTCECMHGA